MNLPTYTFKYVHSLEKHMLKKVNNLKTYFYAKYL